jgi:N-acetylmuramoyl-L-alanine amidase
MFLSAGHSEADPGACAQGRREAEIAVDFRNMVSAYLIRAGVVHETDGTSTRNLPLRDAVRSAARHTVAVEFHCNASSNPNAGGVETLSKPNRLQVGSRICAAVADTLLIRNRGPKLDNSGQHHRLAFCEAGGIIVELFFLTSVTDLRAYDARKWLAAREVARVLASV